MKKKQTLSVKFKGCFFCAGTGSRSGQSICLQERLGVKVQNTGSESVDEEDGKIIYDIKFPVYYKGKKKEFIINIEAQKNSKKQRTVEEQTYSDARGAVLKIRISGEKEDTGRRLWT